MRNTSAGILLALVCAASLLVACGRSGPSDASKDTPQTPAAEQAQPPAETADAAPPPPPAHEAPPPPAPKPSKPAAPAAPKPVEKAPPPPPPPEPIVKTVPAGTPVTVVFLDGVSSAASKAGDSFQTKVAKDVVVDGMTVIPAGSVLSGTVTEAVSLKKIGGKAKLTLDFARLELPSGGTALVHATIAEIGKSETKKDAATIGGAAAGGALLGHVLDKGDHKTKGTVIGALAGAAAGTVIAAKTAGQEIEIPAGTESTLTLDHPAEVSVRP